MSYDDSCPLSLHTYIGNSVADQDEGKYLFYSFIISCPLSMRVTPVAYCCQFEGQKNNNNLSSQETQYWERCL